MSDRPILDETVIRRLQTLGGDEFVGQMLNIFLDQAPRRIDAALDGARAHSLDAVRRAAHSLVSTAGHMGARRMLRLAEELEAAASGQDWDEVRRLLPALVPTFAEAAAELDRWRARVAA